MPFRVHFDKNHAKHFPNPVDLYVCMRAGEFSRKCCLFELLARVCATGEQIPYRQDMMYVGL